MFPSALHPRPAARDSILLLARSRSSSTFFVLLLFQKREKVINIYPQRKKVIAKRVGDALKNTSVAFPSHSVPLARVT